MEFAERKIIFYRSYFADFSLEQSSMVQEKIEYVFRIIRLIDRIPKKFLDHIESTDGLYEIRISVGTNIYRIFCCFDEGNIIVLFNGFQKKTQKTPVKEIAKAVKLKKEYFEFKNQK